MMSASDRQRGGDGGGGNYTFSKTNTGTGNWNTGGAKVSTGNIGRVGEARNLTPVSQPRVSAIPESRGRPQPVVQMPVRKPVQQPVQVPNYVNPSRVFPSRPSAAQRQGQPFSTYIRSPYSNPATFTPKTIRPSGINGSTHYMTTGPEGGSFQRGDPSANYGNDQYGGSLRTTEPRDTTGNSGRGWGGGGGGGWRKGGNVDKSSVLQRILARSKPKQKAAVNVTQRVTKKTPWKKPSFAKGGAVEAFMKRYPDFKLA